MHAAVGNQLEIVRHLVEHAKANISTKEGKNGSTALGLARGMLNSNVTKYLAARLRKEMTPNKDVEQQSLINEMCQAAEDGDLEFVKQALKKGVHVEAVSSSYKHTPLMHAAVGNQLEIVRHLVEHAKANISTKEGKNGSTALGLARGMLNSNVTKYLAARLRRELVGNKDELYKERTKGPAEQRGQVDQLTKREKKSTTPTAPVHCDWESVDRVTFGKMDETEVFIWLKSAQKRFKIKDSLIEAIAEQELMGSDLLSMSSNDILKIAKKEGRARRLNEALAFVKSNNKGSLGKLLANDAKQKVQDSKSNKFAESKRGMGAISLKQSVRSQFGVVRRGENTTIVLYHKDSREVKALITRKYVEWVLVDNTCTHDKNASVWLLSLSYWLSFETIFKIMKKKNAKEAVFFSDMNSELWKQRYEMEARDDSDKRSFVQLRPEREEHYSENLQWELDFLKELRGGYIEQYRLPTVSGSA